MTKIMIATPAGGGNVNIPYLLSFASTVNLLVANGIEVEPAVVKSGSLLVAERNRLIQAFWESDCTHLLCIDADLGWPAEAVLAMLSFNKEFIAGCYPARTQENIFFYRPAKDNNDCFIQDKAHNHLLLMEYIPAGFMLIARDAIKKMQTQFPELYYSPKHSENKDMPGYCFFDTEVWEGEFWGEDYVFSRRVRQSGIDIWVDPFIQFNHDGKVGMLAELISQKHPQHFKTLSEAA
jgi:hypothetical protein